MERLLVEWVWWGSFRWWDGHLGRSPQGSPQIQFWKCASPKWDKWTAEDIPNEIFVNKKKSVLLIDLYIYVVVDYHMKRNSDFARHITISNLNVLNLCRLQRQRKLALNFSFFFFFFGITSNYPWLLQTVTSILKIYLFFVFLRFFHSLVPL